MPSSYILYHDWGIEYVAEPGDGQHANLPDGTLHSDDAGNTYNDGKYYTLCGPGAADVAMYWWPYLSNDATHSVVDHLPGAEPKQLTWYGEDGLSSTGTQAYRQRGYMTYLAFGIGNVPGWSGRAMLPESYYQTGINGGATLQAMNTAMNWEASSESNTSYFYIVTWNNTIPSGQLATYLHNDITTDIANSNVPMVVEVDARQLPNWGEAARNRSIISSLSLATTIPLASITTSTPARRTRGVTTGITQATRQTCTPSLSHCLRVL